MEEDLNILLKNLEAFFQKRSPPRRWADSRVVDPLSSKEDLLGEDLKISFLRIYIFQKKTWRYLPKSFGDSIPEDLKGDDQP